MNFPAIYNSRPAVYVISPTIQIAHTLESAAIQLDAITLAFDSWSTFLIHYDEMTPNCIVLCVEGNAAATIEAIERMLGVHRDAQMILCVSNWDISNIIRAIKAGVSDVLEMDGHAEKLKAGISTALSRDALIRRRARLSIPKAVADTLSTEEQRILALMVEGKTIKEVGTELDLSVRTIHYRKKSIFTKLGVQNRSNAIEMVLRLQHENETHPEAVQRKTTSA